MAAPPRYLCPQCGHNLRMSSGTACPECGFFLGPAKVHHRGAVRYWHFSRVEQRMDVLLLVLWLIAAGLGYYVISLEPRMGIVVVTALAGATVVGMGYYLPWRRGRKNQ